MKINDFIEELKKININPTCEQLNQLDKYYNLLIESNNKMNLTAITDKNDVYLKHFYDSLTLNKIIDLNSINNMCDIGTGAGFPGIVIKILFPKIKLTLVDSLSKRLIFLKEVISELKLSDINIINSRAEDYSSSVREEYDLVTARAVAPLSILLEYCSPLIKEEKYFVSMKGNIGEELNCIPNCEKKLNITLKNKIVFQLPFDGGTRTLIIFVKNGKTSKLFPRKYSEMKKRPL